MAEDTCTVIENGERCTGPRLSRGYCRKHYQRLIRRGSVFAVLPKGAKRASPFILFWSKVDASGGRDACWLWLGNKPNGYGLYTNTSLGTGKAHRFAYEFLIGPIPKGRELDHLCRTPACVNPLHLEPVTHLENVRRGRAGARNRAKTPCKNGHEFTPENTFMKKMPNGNVGRECRTCRRRYMRDYYRARRATRLSSGLSL